MKSETNGRCACGNCPPDMCHEAVEATLLVSDAHAWPVSQIKLSVVMANSFRALADRMRMMWGVLRQFAPYAAIEFLLPGGTIVAILLWLYRRRRVALATIAPQGNILR